MAKLRKKKKTSRHANNENNSIIFYLLTTIATILIFAVLSYAVINFNTNKDNPLSSGKYNHYAILVDITDEISEVQKESINVEIEHLLESMTGPTKIDLYEISQNSNELITPILSVETFGRGDDNSELTSNKPRLLKKWIKEFKAPISAYFKTVESKNIAKQSNIMEAIQAIGLKTFAKTNSNDKSLIIISDFLQNNNNFSFYKTKTLNFDQFKETKYFTKISSGKLNDVDCRLFLIRRDNFLNIQNIDFVNFWINYFTSQESVVTEVTSIDGA